MKINENILAKKIAEVEGGRKNLSIAQIKEVQKLLLDYLATEWSNGNEVEVIKLIISHIQPS